MGNIILPYSERKQKRKLQHYFYSTCGIKSSVLALLGPDQDYVSLVEKCIASSLGSRIVSYEINYEVYARQKYMWNIPRNIRAKLHLYGGSIVNAKPQRFIDLDLMGCPCTQWSIIKKLFKKQYGMNTKQKRVFISTVCIRQSSIKQIISLLAEMLHLDIKLIGHIKNEFGTNYLLGSISKEFTIELYTYRDGATMASFRIMYKTK